MHAKTYSEVAQATYFKAATAMFKLAASVLNDCQHPLEFRSPTYEWARDLAAKHARAAQALKEQALEAASVTDGRTVTAYNKAQREYTEAVTRHLRLRDEYMNGGNR